MNTVSKTDYAKLVGVSKQAINKATSTGSLQDALIDGKIAWRKESAVKYGAKHGHPRGK